MLPTRLLALTTLLILVGGCTRKADHSTRDLGPTHDMGGLALADTTLPDATVGVFYQAQLSVTGAHAGTASWAISDGALPQGLALDSSSGPTVRVVGTPTVQGTFAFTVAVTDGFGGSDSRALALTVSDGLVIAGTLPGAREGQPFVATLSVKGGHGTIFGWSVSGGALPSGVMMNANGGTLTIHGTPAPGPASFTITADDDIGEKTSRSFDLDVLSSLTLTVGTLPEAVQNRLFSLDVHVKGGTGAYQWSLSGTVPPGLTIGSGSGADNKISGTLSTAGTFSCNVNVSDGNGGSTTTPITITVIPALQIQTTHLADGQLAVAYSASLTAFGGASTAYQWSIASGSLPPGLTLTTGAGAAPAATLSGTPTRIGSYSFTIAVTTASGDRASTSFTMSVGNNPPHITTTTLPAGTWGTSYSASINGTSNVGGAISWKIVAGSLPPGLALGASSTTSVALSGTPKLVGNFAFTVQMSDAGGSDEKQLSVGIAHAGGIEVNRALLPSGRVGVAYSASVDCRGSSGAVTWSVDRGTLPDGLTLTGNGASASISGTPTTSGFSTFTLRASDGSGASDAQSFAIRVAPARIYVAHYSYFGQIIGANLGTLAVREIQARTPGAEATLFSNQAIPGAPTPAFSPSGDWLTQSIFSVVSNSWPVTFYDLRGTPTTTATANANDFGPAWSPDDQHALIEYNKVTLTPVNLSGAKPVVGNPLSPTGGFSGLQWSADGTRFASWSSDGTVLSISDGKTTTTIAMPPGLTSSFQIGQQAWLADGSGILFEGRYSTNPNDQLFYVDAANGAQPMALSDAAVPLLSGSIQVSPDGRTALFFSTVPTTILRYLWSVDLSTRQLALAKQANQSPYIFAGMSWSSDSQAILFSMAENTAPRTLARAQLGAGEPILLNIGDAQVQTSNALHWGADSAHVLCSATNGSYELALDGSAPLLFPAGLGTTPQPVSASPRAYVYVSGGLQYVVARQGSFSPPTLLDVDVAWNAYFVSRELESVVYVGSQNGTYLVDLSGAAPPASLQLFPKTTDTVVIALGAQ